MGKFKEVFGKQEIAGILTEYWYLFLIAVLLILAFYFAVLIIKKSKRKQEKIIVNTLHNDNNKSEKSKKNKVIRFTVNSDDAGIKCFDYVVNKKVLFGRADFCDVVFDDAKMSRYHFYIQKQKKKYMITDLNSANGTYLNGMRLKDTQILKNKDRIFAGVTTITVSFQE